MRRVAGIVLALASACTPHEPPTPDGSPSVAPPDLPPFWAATSTTARTSTPTPTPTPTPTSTSTPTPTPTSTESPAADPSLLPQTHDVPHASGAAFDARVASLWAAIVSDDPSRGMPFFFPLGAYRQVKDVADPAADWKNRLVAAYQADIHALHARLGADAARAKLVALEVPGARARWVEPGEEWNRIGYFRVFGSKLRYDVDGKGGAFDVKSLISWRGEWFVVHLNAIK